MKRTKKTIDTLNSIIADLSEIGTSIDLETDKDAVNMRQRFYNYRNSIIAMNKDQALIKKLQRVKIAVDVNTVHFTFGMPDYLDQIKVNEK